MTEPPIGGLIQAAAEVQAACARQGWRFCFIGGLAVLRWGEPRVTRHADLTLLTGFGNEMAFVDALLGMFAGRLPDAREFASRNRVVLLEARNGVAIDISLGALPFEERLVMRATDFAISEDVRITTCSAEDLIVLKAFAGRAHDWQDIEGILIRQGGRIDEDLIWSELLPLLELKEASADAETLRALLDRERRSR